MAKTTQLLMFIMPNRNIRKVNIRADALLGTVKIRGN